MVIKRFQVIYLPIILLLALLLASYLMSYLPLIIPMLYVLLSLISFLLYFKDKRAAIKGTWRVQEGTLHSFALCCGWPGALLGQQCFRHKTQKTSFRVMYWLCVIANSGALIWLLTPQGSPYLNSTIFWGEELVFNEMAEGSVKTLLLILLAYH